MVSFIFFSMEVTWLAMCWLGHLQFLPKGSLEQETLIYLSGSLSTILWRQLYLLVYCLPREISAAPPQIYPALCNSRHQSSLCLLPAKPSKTTMYSASPVIDFNYCWIDLTDLTTPKHPSPENPTLNPHAMTQSHWVYTGQGCGQTTA